MAARIFVNYRRDDDPSAAARVRDGLAAKFGKSAIFMDVDNLLAGQRFGEELEKALSQCDMLLAIIGPRWMEQLQSRATSGERDYVREEIAGALKRRIVVIPVRVGREGQLPSLPRADDLPEDIRDLVHYQKHDVAHERFSRDIADLIAAIAAVRRARQAPRAWGKIAAVFVALAIFGALAWTAPSILTGSFTASGDAERQRLAKLASDTEAKRQDAKGETTGRMDEAEASRNAREAEEEQRKRQEADAEKKAEEERKAQEAAAAAEEQKREEERAKAAAKEAERQRVAMLAAEEERKRKEAARKAAEEQRANEAAEAQEAGRVFRDCEGKSSSGTNICPEMVVVPVGEFTMGSPAREEGRSDHEGPPRKVTISNAFAVGKFEVTVNEYFSCEEANVCKLPEWREAEYRVNKGTNKRYWGLGAALTGNRHPIVGVSWYDAKLFVEWLSKKTGKPYRLLTEAEWEYAARAGTTTPFSTGATITTDLANYDGAKYRKTTIEVGSFKPNAFGLYDMHGNVSEWVEDCYVDSYVDAPADQAARKCTYFGVGISRGGSWSDVLTAIRSANRNANGPLNKHGDLGFRVARTLTP